MTPWQGRRRGRRRDLGAEVTLEVLDRLVMLTGVLVVLEGVVVVLGMVMVWLVILVILVVVVE